MAAPLVAIPDCAAYHLLGDEQLHLATNAELSLVNIKGSSDTPPLTLVLGESLAFPLDDDTLIGTQTGNGQVYLLRPHLENVTGPQGWVKIELPEGVEVEGSELGKLRDTFEDILVEHGFLHGSSIKAGGDELAAGARGAGATGAERIAGAVESFKASRASTDAPMSFSRTTHSRTAQAASATGTAAGYVATATAAIGGFSHAVGSSIATTFGLGEKAEEDKSEARKTLEATGVAFGDVGGGITDGTSHVSTSASTGAREAIVHTKGEEAASVASNLGATGSNVGSVAGGVYVTTAAAYHGAEAARGAADVDLDPEAFKSDLATKELETVDLQK